MVLASWGLPLPFDHVTSHAAAAPAGEAARERYEAAGGDWYGNWLVSAPTNSGKTRIFIEITRWVWSLIARAWHARRNAVAPWSPNTVCCRLATHMPSLLLYLPLHLAPSHAPVPSQSTLP